MKRFLHPGLPAFILGLTVLFFIIDPADCKIFPRCYFHLLTGYYCPGCGSQRAIHSLLHLDFYGVIRNNFLFIPAALIIIYHYSHKILNKKFNLNLPNILYLKNTPLIILLIITIFWILRNLPVYPFILLAPAG
jgi:hypothetical protein